jgi:hypothetical protein
VSDVVSRTTGELIDLRDAPVEVIGQIAEDIDARLSELRSDKRALSDEITARLDHEGRRSMEISGWRFETTAPEEREFDVAGLQAVLAELVAEGTISQKKADACLAWEPKPVWAQIYGNIDPDFSRDLAERVIFAADRAGARGHLGAAPSHDEVMRAQNALARHGVSIDYRIVAAVLHDCFVYGWGQ